MLSRLLRDDEFDVDDDDDDGDDDTVYSGYSGHVYSGHSDILATFSGTKYIYSIICRSDIVAIRI